MTNMKTLKSVTILLTLLVSGNAYAAEMNHSQHTSSGPEKPKTESLNMVDSQPASGKAREAGYDKRYNMESTTVKNSLATQCAQASRGIIILDNKTWERCGGKTKGVARGDGQEKSGHVH